MPGPDLPTPPPLRITFAGLLLEHCCRVVSMYSGVAMLAVGTLIVQMVYVVLWAHIAQVRRDPVP